jgi:hypothetical protein
MSDDTQHAANIYPICLPEASLKHGARVMVQLTPKCSEVVLTKTQARRLAESLNSAADRAGEAIKALVRT